MAAKNNLYSIASALRLRGPIRLLTSGRNNSLAAAMEILSYVTSGGGQGEILHGNPEYIAVRLAHFFRSGLSARQRKILRHTGGHRD